MRDSLDNEVTCTGADALAAYERAMDAHLHAWTGTLSALDDALAADPGFALAHALRALPLATWGHMVEAREAAARAQACAGGTTEREQSQVALIAALVSGQAPEALQRVQAHALRWPTDPVAIGTALGAFGLLAFSGQLDHDAARLALVEAIAPHFPDDHAWLLAHRGWARIECGRVGEGKEFAQRSLTLRRANGNIAHIVMHSHFEAGEPDAALTFVDAWLPDYPADALLWGHLHWHAALAHMDLGQVDAALGRLLGPLADHVAHGPPYMQLTDVVSLSWRLGLQDTRGLPWARVAALAQRHFATGSNVFGELHLAMLAAARRDLGALGACETRLRARGERGHAGAVTAAHWAAGLGALARGERDAAAEALAACRADLPRVGGSHAQRTVVEVTQAALALPYAD
jgi:hypothetical protein